ncbi:transcriptional regulator, LuxR family [Granulicella pectinivorans]|jgi:DNA-binding CsgD family transcriptional regulator|uniref:Transcriptional regulator, LuxR family n=1 Tax=Granulicella pectinivorans TaxID=474950 RepID=A0A1I6MKP3_9BACT|nr:hypothetical protein [Granulicella pectinivorans]SFS16178.1 transcriptional regulator, LuxR family [Granulicella pectinivorans]
MVENPEVLFGGTTQLLALIEMIYASVHDPTLWPAILDRIGVAAQGRQTFMFTQTSDPALPSALISTSTDPEALTQFIDYYAAINIIAEPADAVFRDGDIRYSHWVIADDELERSEFYNDFFKPFDMHYSYGVKIPLPQQPSIYISSQRSKLEAPFADREGHVLKVLMPHIARAFDIHHRYRCLNAHINAVATALETMDHAIMGLNEEGKVVLSNRPADEIARTSDALHLVNGSLSSPDLQQDQHLQNLISGAVQTRQILGVAPGGSILLRSPSGRSPLQFTVSPCPTPFGQGRNRIVAIVMLHDPEQVPMSRAEILRSLYALTPTEARLADMLFQGKNIVEAAEALRTTQETARFHSKRILAKTSTHRQAELIRLMASLPGSRTA